MTESYVADINQEDRKTFYTSCMSLKGWEQKLLLLAISSNLVTLPKELSTKA
ncbi:hypothetical protein IC611_04370 [Proteus mirabilis]